MRRSSGASRQRLRQRWCGYRNGCRSRRESFDDGGFEGVVGQHVVEVELGEAGACMGGGRRSVGVDRRGGR
jgi:hypothetical protein